ncbi:hypothetical protein B0J17DRAFT_309132 [Rhizoctonia solani]|nr:hypothetical protein B0J17DRAFT_309132 [Rhizoctonia solani]
MYIAACLRTSDRSLLLDTHAHCHSLVRQLTPVSTMSALESVYAHLHRSGTDDKPKHLIFFEQCNRPWSNPRTDSSFTIHPRTPTRQPPLRDTFDLSAPPNPTLRPPLGLKKAHSNSC